MALIMLLFAEIGIGMLNVLLLAPVWLQILHLLVADTIWISLVLASAALIVERPYELEIRADSVWEQQAVTQEARAVR